MEAGIELRALATEPVTRSSSGHTRSPFRGMVFGMATTKVTITLPDDQIRLIRELVAAGKAASLSAFVKHAVTVGLFDAAGWRTMLDDALQQTRRSRDERGARLGGRSNSSAGTHTGYHG